MRTRIFLSFTLIVLVSVASFVLVARWSTASEVRSFMFRGGMIGLDRLVTTLEDYYRTNNSWLGVEQLFNTSMHGNGRGPGWPGGSGMMAGMMNQRLLLADPSGDVIVDTGTDTASPVISRLSQSDLETGIPLHVDGRTVGILLAEGAARFNALDEIALLNRLNRVALIQGLVASGFALILAFLLAYRLIRPVQALTNAATRLAGGDLSQRVAIQGDDELASLGRAFNHMASSLEQVEKGRRAMTADIAHELRTPLAVQRAQLEALQDGIYLPTAENLTPLLEQNRLLTRLVDDLRTLALADAGQLSLERAPTDFLALVKNVVERFKPQAEAQQIQLMLTLENSGTSPIDDTIQVDPGRMEQVLSNLLSNALRYTPEGGKIELRYSSNGGNTRLSIRDSGPGIPPEAIPHVFERFYRADRARSRAEGGTGLGLAIARQLVEAHGGSLTARNHPTGGAEFTLTLPAKGKA